MSWHFNSDVLSQICLIKSTAHIGKSSSCHSSFSSTPSILSLDSMSTSSSWQSREPRPWGERRTAAWLPLCSSSAAKVQQPHLKLASPPSSHRGCSVVWLWNLFTTLKLDLVHLRIINKPPVPWTGDKHTHTHCSPGPRSVYSSSAPSLSDLVYPGACPVNELNSLLMSLPFGLCPSQSSGLQFLMFHICKYILT